MAYQFMEMQEVEHEAPTVPLVLSFCSLSYSVNTSSDTKVLLNDISGEANGGEIFAVLGPSGSGKTTFLDALANRISKESLKGNVYLNGEHLDSDNLSSVSSYVLQNDVLYPMLTVEETLMFAAEFRLPKTLSKMEKRKRVQDLIHQLGLENATKTIIGNEVRRGVSGGERRRVSIGVEIICRPNILFLDEPTSGLDSTCAYTVVKILQGIAQSGSMVIMSIHQPSYRILGILDHVLLLSHGQMIYSGPSKNITSFFADSGHPIHGNENWAEFALDLIQELQDSQEGTHTLVAFSRSWLNMKKSRRFSSTVKIVSQTSVAPTFANPLWKEVAVLSRRSLIITRRTPEEFATLLITTTLTGILFAAIFWRLGNSPEGIIKRLAFFFTVLTTVFYSCCQALPTLFLERHIILRETESNTYRRSSYVVSQALVAIPFLVTISLAYAAVTFWTVGLGGGSSGFLYYVLILIASYWAGNSYVTFLSGFILGPVVSLIVIVGSLSYFYLFCGFFVTRDEIPDYMIWLHYMSILKYPYEALLLNEFDDRQKCFSTGVQIFDYTPLRMSPVDLKEKALQALGSTFGRNVTESTCLMTGVDVLKQQAVTELSMWKCILIIVAYGFLFRILFYFTLVLRNKNTRK